MKLILIIALLTFSASGFSKTPYEKKIDAKRKNKTKSITPKEFFRDVKVNSLGGHLGFVKPNEGDGTISFGLDVPLGTITKYKINLKSSLEYWSASSGILDYSDFIISTYANYHFKKIVKYKFTPYAGSGISLHFYKADVSIPNSTIVANSSSTNIGLDLLAGGFYDWKKHIDFFTEGKYRIVSDASQFTIVAGAIYKFK